MIVVFKTTGDDEYPRMDISSGFQVFADLTAVFNYYFGGNTIEPWATLFTTVTTAFGSGDAPQKLFTNSSATYWAVEAADLTV